MLKCLSVYTCLHCDLYHQLVELLPQCSPQNFNNKIRVSGSTRRQNTLCNWAFRKLVICDILSYIHEYKYKYAMQYIGRLLVVSKRIPLRRSLHHPTGLTMEIWVCSGLLGQIRSGQHRAGARAGNCTASRTRQCTVWCGSREERGRNSWDWDGRVCSKSRGKIIGHARRRICRGCSGGRQCRAVRGSIISRTRLQAISRSICTTTAVGLLVTGLSPHGEILNCDAGARSGIGALDLDGTTLFTVLLRALPI